MTNSSNLNSKKIKIPAKFLWFGFVILVIICVAVVNYLWLNGSFGITPFKNKSSVVINGGSLGAVATAIQLSDLGVDFVLVEPNNQLGGQATVQGVSTFDQHNRAFQYNKLYSQMLKSMQAVDKVFDVRSRGDSFSVDYWGNAITGPGALPKQIVDYFNSRIDSKYGRVIYNTEVVQVFKIGNKIDSVLIKNKNDNKTQRLQADLFLDAGEFSEISRYADVPYGFGMDLQEETGEPQALTTQEMEIFKTGVQNQDGKIGGYGNRLQPITTPFALLDKGYYGNRYSASRIAGFSDQELKTRVCPQLQFQCLEVASGQAINFAFDQPQKGFQEIVFVLSNDIDGFNWLNDIEIRINDKVFEPAEIGPNIYKKEDKFTILKLPYDVTSQQLEVNISNSLGFSLFLSEIIVAPLNQTNKTLSSTLAQIKRVAAYEADLSLANNREENTVKSFNIENWMVPANQDYYLLAQFPEKTFETQTFGKFAVNVFEGGDKIYDAVINPNTDYFQGYFPFYKFTGLDTGGYSLRFVSLDKTTPAVDKILIVPANQVSSFELLRDKESARYNQTKLLDIINIGTSNNVGVSLVKRDRTENIIKTSFINRGSFSKFIARKFVDEGDQLRFNSESGLSQLLVIKANPNHFHNQIYNNFSINPDKQTNDNKTQSYFYPSDTGKYEVYAKVKKTDNPEDSVDFTLRLANQEDLKSEIRFDQNRYQLIGVVNIRQDAVNLRFTPKCSQDCLLNLEIILTEEIPPEYDADFFTNKITFAPNERKILSEGDIVKDFFRFRRILDPFNFFKNSPIPSYIKNRVNFNSLGISQINTGFNDLEMIDVDIEKFLDDDTYRRGVFYRSRLLSAQYFYWLKYDAPRLSYGCQEQEPFCSGARLSLTAEAMGTEDGIASVPYIRDPVRSQGEKTLTFNDFSVKSNLCQNIDQEECVDLELDGQNYKVKKSFFTAFNQQSLASFYYPTDVHRLVNNINPYFDYLLNNNFRTKENLPEFIFGLYDGAIKSGTIDFGHIFNSKVDNLMFCGKNISTTQIANGSTRLHPVEVAVGQACGVIASYLLENKISAVSQLNNPERFRSVQSKMVQNGSVIAPLDDNELFVLLRENKWEVLLAYYRAILDQFVEVNVSQDEIKQFVLLRLLPNQSANGQDLQKLSEKLGWQSFLIDTNLSSTSLEDLIKTAPTESRDKIISAVQFHQQTLTEVGLSQSRQIDDGYQLTRGDLAMIASYFTT